MKKALIYKAQCKSTLQKIPESKSALGQRILKFLPQLLLSKSLPMQVPLQSRFARRTCAPAIVTEIVLRDSNYRICHNYLDQSWYQRTFPPHSVSPSRHFTCPSKAGCTYGTNVSTRTTVCLIRF